MPQEKYPLYPSVVDLIRRYMEDSVWDLYKAHVIRDLKHYEGRVDPSKKCKYCLSCQLRFVQLTSHISSCFLKLPICLLLYLSQL